MLALRFGRLMGNGSPDQGSLVQESSSFESLASCINLRLEARTGSRLKKRPTFCSSCHGFHCEDLLFSCDIMYFLGREECNMMVTCKRMNQWRQYSVRESPSNDDAVCVRPAKVRRQTASSKRMSRQCMQCRITCRHRRRATVRMKPPTPFRIGHLFCASRTPKTG